MSKNMMNRSYEVQVEGNSLGRYAAKTFGWMLTGFLITSVVAVDSAMTGTTLYIYSLRCWPLALLATGLRVAVYLSARIERMSVDMTGSLFFLYAALNGVVPSAYLFAFSLEILWMVFGIIALLFGIMALVGRFDNINFARLRPFMLGGLVFLFFYWILAMFIDLSVFDTTVSTVGIFLLLVLTAYDVKKVQVFHVYYGQAPEMVAKASIFSTLQLYLDFINLFVYITGILERRR